MNSNKTLVRLNRCIIIIITVKIKKKKEANCAFHKVADKPLAPMDQTSKISEKGDTYLTLISVHKPRNNYMN